MRIKHPFIFAILLLMSAACQPAAPAVQTVIYDDAVAIGWEDWSWETRDNLYSTAHVHTGTQAVEARFNAWGGFSLRSAAPIDPTAYTHITFWAMAPEGEQPLFVFTQSADAGGESEKATITAGPRWQEFTVALADLGNPSPIQRINLQEATGTPVSVVYIDDLKLIGK